LLGKHVSDPIFLSFSKLDWQYYAVQLSIDMEEKHDYELGMADYSAQFSNYDAVKKIRTERQQRKLAKQMGVEYEDPNTNKNIKIDDKAFSEILRKKFGKPLKSDQ
jgi:hypothetical protein